MRQLLYVCSRSLPAGERDGVTFVHDAVAEVRTLKATGTGKPLWLWGGGQLFRELLPTPGPRLPLSLRSHRLFKTTGTVVLDYDVIST